MLHIQFVGGADPLWRLKRGDQPRRRTGAPGKRFALPSRLFFALGLLSKPMVVALPFAFLLLISAPWRTLRAPPTQGFAAVPVWRLIREKAPFLCYQPWLRSALLASITAGRGRWKSCRSAIGRLTL